MSDKINDGGPAFSGMRRETKPHGYNSGDEAANYITRPYEGSLTLRDYFAAKAMQGVLANPNYESEAEMALLSRKCYEQADEMLKARKQ